MRERIRSEKSIQNSVMKYLKKVPDSWFCKISDKYMAGVPDIIGCYKGYYIAIELKTEKGKVAPIQHWVHEQIRKAHGVIWVCTSVEEVKKHLADYEKTLS